jgi:hypothetical protein
MLPVAVVYQSAFCKGDRMTRCFYDSEDNSFLFHASSVNQILKHVEALHLTPDTVARRIQLGRLPQSPVAIPPGALRELSLDSITGALECLDQVEAAIPSLAKDFLDTPGLEAFQNLLQLYEGLYWITALVDKLSACFHMRLEGTFFRGVAVPEHQRTLVSILKRLMESQERKNFIQIPDLLQDEIAALVPVWREMFGLIWKRVNTA